MLFVVLGELLLTSLNFAVYYYSRKYDRCVQQHAAALPQQNERMLRLCCLCIGAVVSSSLLWLVLLVVDLSVLEGALYHVWWYAYVFQHFTPFNALLHLVIFFIFSGDGRKEARKFAKETRDAVVDYWVPRYPEPKIFTLESLRFTQSPLEGKGWTWTTKAYNNAGVNQIFYARETRV